ncbi:MAG: cytochrome c oxidase assembly protein subunit 15 [Marivirga sp.]|jgi:cytochrome c oxidase assembly protein subunit 15
MQRQKLNFTHIVSSYYRKLTTVTVIAVYILILAGGVVRSTGSGMGCPDWPKCFGTWVPPTDVGQLPADYQEFYSDYRHQKNVKFARYLDFVGYSEVGQQILSDESIKDEAEFNIFKTWTEYVNRVIGVFVGFFIVLLLVGSLKYIRTYPKIFWLSFASFILVLFQGWLGSIVVSTNLLQWLITLHMVLALVILAVLTALFYFSNQRFTNSEALPRDKSRKVSVVLAISLLLLLVQVVFGTQVREALDLVAVEFNMLSRDNWIEKLGLVFYIHRSYSLLLLAISIYLFYTLFKLNSKVQSVVSYVKVLILLFVLEIGSGAIMAYFAIPSWVQPVHLLIGCLLFGWQFYLLLIFLFNRQAVKSDDYAL